LIEPLLQLFDLPAELQHLLLQLGERRLIIILRASIGARPISIRPGPAILRRIGPLPRRWPRIIRRIRLQQPADEENSDTTRQCNNPISRTHQFSS
jgi:hypothetical protein